MPETSQIMHAGTGEYWFEDTNLDCYSLFDYKQTELYHGLNREDEWYESRKNLAKPEWRRKKKMPSIKEFWDSWDLKEFRLVCDDQAQYRKFKRWITREMQKADPDKLTSYDDECLALHREATGVCLGDWNEKGVINTDIGV